MANKKKIKISDDFFSAPETAEGASSRRTTTEAEAMNIILGVSRPEAEASPSRPERPGRNVSPAKHRQVAARASVQVNRGSARKAERSVSSPSKGSAPERETSPSPALVGTVLGFAFNMTTLFAQNITLPWRFLFRSATALARSASSVVRD